MPSDAVFQRIAFDCTTVTLGTSATPQNKEGTHANSNLHPNRIYRRTCQTTRYIARSRVWGQQTDSDQASHGRIWQSSLPASPIVERVVDILKGKGAEPFLFDTPAWYEVSSAGLCMDIWRPHEKNGFSQETMGCPILIDDQYEIIESPLRIGEVCIPKKLLEADGLVVLTHFKGHPDASFGDASRTSAWAV